MWLFLSFMVFTCYDVLKMKDLGLFYKKAKIYLKQTRNRSREIPTHAFRTTEPITTFWNIEPLMSWSSRKKKECIFCNVYFVQQEILVVLVFYLNMYKLNNLSGYIPLYIIKYCFISFILYFQSRENPSAKFIYQIIPPSKNTLRNK